MVCKKILAFWLAVNGLILSAVAQTPTGIDPGYNDEEVILWNDPVYIIIALVILLAVILGWLRFMGNRRRRRRDRDH